MGGYAAFIWPAYGASALAIGGLAIALVRRRAAAKKRLAELERGRSNPDA